MRPRSLSHLADGVLLGELNTLIARDRDTTAEMLLYLAEVDRRRLYVPAGYPSMYKWCVRVLHLSEAAAYKRIRVARLARCFPAILPALAEGRLHLTAVMLLSPFLTHATAAELFAAAEHRSKAEIELYLASRFPQSDVPTDIRALIPATKAQLAPERVGGLEPQRVTSTTGISGSEAPPETPAPSDFDGSSQTIAPALPSIAAPHPRVAPIAPERYAIQFTMPQSMHDKLRRAQELLPQAGGVPEVIERALDVLITQLEKRKCAATDKPRAPRTSYRSQDPRYTPADVVRTVWVRDQDQCTYVSTAGHRCEERSGLEIDHLEPPRAGVTPTAEMLRLRCRAHNQYAAELRYGDGFMHEIRERAKRATAARRATAAARDAAESRSDAGLGHGATP